MHPHLRHWNRTPSSASHKTADEDAKRKLPRSLFFVQARRSLNKDGLSQNGFGQNVFARVKWKTRLLIQPDPSRCSTPPTLVSQGTCVVWKLSLMRHLFPAVLQVTVGSYLDLALVSFRNSGADLLAAVWKISRNILTMRTIFPSTFVWNKSVHFLQDVPLGDHDGCVFRAMVLFQLVGLQRSSGSSNVNSKNDDVGGVDVPCQSR